MPGGVFRREYDWRPYQRRLPVLPSRTPPISEFIDLFPGPSFAAHWTGLANAGTASIVSGRARFPDTTAWIDSQIWNFDEGELVVEIPTLPSVTGPTGYYVAEILLQSQNNVVADYLLQEYVSGGNVKEVGVAINNSALDYIPVSDFTDYRWVKFTESGGTTNVYGSPDGQAWSLLKTASSASDVGATSVRFYVERTSTDSSGYAEFDNVNNPPVAAMVAYWGILAS